MSPSAAASEAHTILAFLLALFAGDDGDGGGSQWMTWRFVARRSRFCGCGLGSDSGYMLTWKLNLVPARRTV